MFAMGVVSMRGVFFWCALSYLLLIPAITMRFSQEFQSGSFELMATMPIRDEELVFGKFLSAVSLLFVTLLVDVYSSIDSLLAG